MFSLHANTSLVCIMDCENDLSFSLSSSQVDIDNSSKWQKFQEWPKEEERKSQNQSRSHQDDVHSRQAARKRVHRRKFIPEWKGSKTRSAFFLSELYFFSVYLIILQKRLGQMMKERNWPQYERLNDTEATCSHRRDRSVNVNTCVHFFFGRRLRRFGFCFFLSPTNPMHKGYQ